MDLMNIVQFVIGIDILTMYFNDVCIVFGAGLESNVDINVDSMFYRCTEYPIDDNYVTQSFTIMGSMLFGIFP